MGDVQESRAASTAEGWLKEDPCFLSLALSLYRDTHEDRLPAQDIALIDQHMGSCCCWENVLIASQQTADPEKRRIYLDLYHSSLWARMKRDGGDFQLEVRPEEGMYFRMTYPPYMDAPYTGGEVFYSHDRCKTPHQAIFDVRSQDLYDNPLPVLHYLDRGLGRNIVDYNKPGGAPIQFWSVLGEEACAPYVRWQGRLKLVAEDFRIHPRYAGLVRFHDFKQSGGDEKKGGVGYELVQLLDLIAEEYDGRGGLAAFLNSRLPLRGIDGYRARQKDGMARLADEPTHEQDGQENSDAPEPVIEQVEDDSSGGWREREMESIRRQDHPKLLALLRSTLDEEERGLLDLKLKGLTDAAVGNVLGIGREAVNRKLRRIREKAARLKV